MNVHANNRMINDSYEYVIDSIVNVYFCKCMFYKKKLAKKKNGIHLHLIYCYHLYWICVFLILMHHFFYNFIVIIY